MINNLQRVITESQAAIDNKCVFVHMKTPDLQVLLDGIDEAKQELYAQQEISAHFHKMANGYHYELQQLRDQLKENTNDAK